ncbi:hypothetical protein BB934_34625 (plasmid) [Microvirga ossetica]|uniref:Uncharacterized protein n=1 Tax=Microvirga ossetica TaxID=1882682 RepID=A0A1B2ESX1_9HYPH|nr:hypothetical protein BB934_33245 [Microvirga ossetica]ANY83422.1 hypothetical protein BB934_34625 [Microvirga ossetica]
MTGVILRPYPVHLSASYQGIHLHPKILIHDRLTVSLAPIHGLPPTEPLRRTLDHVLAVAVDHNGEFLRDSFKRLDGCRHLHLVVGCGSALVALGSSSRDKANAFAIPLGSNCTLRFNSIISGIVKPEGRNSACGRSKALSLRIGNVEHSHTVV